jgi:hypothetical protein
MGGARSGGQGGLKARARQRAFVLDRSEHAVTIKKITKADLTLDLHHGIYRDRVAPISGEHLV